MIADVLIRSCDSFAISGQVLLYDLTNVTWGHLLEIEPKMIMNIMSIIQYVLPARLKGIHMYHPPTGFETFAKLVINCLSEKNRKRVNKL